MRGWRDIGFLDIEIIFVGVILLLVIGLVVTGVMSPDTRCIGGYLFSNPAVHYQSSQQILDEQGHGIPCGERRGP